jgi:hypothetical protein
MKTLRLFMLVAVVATVAMAADSPSVAGKWAVSASVAGYDVSSQCTFTQNAAELTGSCSSDAGTFDVRGKVDGNKVTWNYQSSYNGGPLTFVYDGAIDASPKITGTVNIPEYNVDGNFTATPAK